MRSFIAKRDSLSAGGGQLLPTQLHRLGVPPPLTAVGISPDIRPIQKTFFA
jgi:hypothetical protein